MSTDSRRRTAPHRSAQTIPGQARHATPVPARPSLDGIEDKWARQWEESGVVQV